MKKDKLIVALDVNSLKKAKALVDKLFPVVRIFKVGSELFTACGPQVIKMIHKKRAKVFLDLKFHDIPNTVARAIEAAKDMGVFMVNLHASGGKDMMRKAVLAKGKGRHPVLLAVTVLTSMDKRVLKETGINSLPQEQVRRLALLAKGSGTNGVVCSAHEAADIRRVCGKNFVIVTPGIRPVYFNKQDQKRVASPAYAFRQGSDYIVVGRPITEAKNPKAAAISMLCY